MMTMLALASAHSKKARKIVIAIDVHAAYPKSKRGDRPVTYVAIPPGLDRLAEECDNTAMCLALETTMWGEPPAGNEWEKTLAQALHRAGFSPSESVPAFWVKTLLNGERAVAGVIVDDVLMVYPADTVNAGSDILDTFRGVFGEDEIKFTTQPEVFNGFVLTYFENGAINVSAARKFKTRSQITCLRTLPTKTL